MADLFDIAGRINSTSEEHVAAVAGQVLDEAKGKKQSEINADVCSGLNAHASAIDGLENQNYVNLAATSDDTTIAAVFARTGTTPSPGTIYRVANWNHQAVTPYDTGYYSEYAVSVEGGNVSYTPLMVVNTGVDTDPEAGSRNLITSGAVQKALNELILEHSLQQVIDTGALAKYNYMIDAEGNWNGTTTSKHVIVPVKEGEMYYIKANSEKNCHYAFLTSNTVSSGTPAPLVNETNRVILTFGATAVITIPNTCTYLYLLVQSTSSQTGFLPDKLIKIDELTKVNGEKLIKLDAIVESQAELNVGDVYYNKAANIKKIRKKTGESSFIQIPFYDGAIYTYQTELYIWNGTDLVKATKEIQTITTTSAVLISPSKVQLTAIRIKFSNTAAMVIYADGATGDNHTSVIYDLAEYKHLVLTADFQIIVRGVDAVLSSDIVLVSCISSNFAGGILLPQLEKSAIEQGFLTRSYGVKTPTECVGRVLNKGTSTYIQYTGYSNQSIYFIPVLKGEIISITATEENPTYFRTAFSPNEIVISGDDTQRGLTDYRDLTEGNIDLTLTAPYDGYLVVYHQNTLYTDMQIEVAKGEAATISTISTSNDTVYNGDGSIYVKDLYITYNNTSGSTTIQVRKTIEPLESTFNYVLTKDNDVVAKLSADLMATDILLLRVSVGSGTYNYFGGWLYADYCKKNLSLAGNPFAGKKLICTGGSNMAGYTLKATDMKFSEIIAARLGMEHRNYAIAGSSVAKHDGDYEDIYVNYTDWQEAVNGGELDTTKKYLVKDEVDTYPYPVYHLWKYSNGSWGMIDSGEGEQSGMNAKAPLVDRMIEMDTDADVILIDTGGNDWAHNFTPFGDDLSRDKTTFCGAMHLICQYLVNTYPGKVIIWCSRPCAWRYSSPNSTTWNAPNSAERTNQQYADMQKQILREYGISYFDLGAKLGFSQSNRWWCGDPKNGGFYAHANAQAQPFIADVLIKEILSYKV